MNYDACLLVGTLLPSMPESFRAKHLGFKRGTMNHKEKDKNKKKTKESI